MKSHVGSLNQPIEWKVERVDGKKQNEFMNLCCSILLSGLNTKKIKDVVKSFASKRPVVDQEVIINNMLLNFK